MVGREAQIFTKTGEVLKGVILVSNTEGVILKEFTYPCKELQKDRRGEADAYLTIPTGNIAYIIAGGLKDLEKALR